jgi:hypothetical protein
MKALLLWLFNAPNRLICRILDHRWVYGSFQYQATTRECRRCLAVHTPEDDPIFQEMVDDVVTSEEEHLGTPEHLDVNPVIETIRTARALKSHSSKAREVDYLEEQFRLLVATMDTEWYEHRMTTNGSCPPPEISPWEIRDRIAEFSEDEDPDVVKWCCLRVNLIDLQIHAAKRLRQEQDTTTNP